jgi:hypothetical protein
MLGAPASLSSIMVVGPQHHAAATRVGDSSEVGQREHMVRQGFTGKCWSEFLCALVAISNLDPAAPSGGGGLLPRGMRSVDTPPPTPAAGAPPAGLWQEPTIGYIHMLVIQRLVGSMIPLD